MLAEDVRWLHVEASSKCNAWCPSCPRNISGHGLHPNTIEQDLDLLLLKKTVESLPNLYAIQFCGNHGDPCAAKKFLDMIDIVKFHVKKIQIHTNGSIRNVEWWKKLAHKLADVEHDVWFGIDGLAGIHELYRQGTNWDKIIENAKTFIENGGYATWQFIPFKHNEHQIKDCLKLSQKLKFKKFKLVKSFRRIEEAQDYVSGEPYLRLEPSSKVNQSIINLSKKSVVNKENCMHMSQPSVYLDASGSYSYCCYYMSNWASHKIKFDSLENIFYNSIDISSSHCINSCGS
jgi:hypothetical protein